MRIARPAGGDPERIIEHRTQRHVPRSRRVLNQDRERLRLLLSGRERRYAFRWYGEEFVVLDHQSHPKRSAAASFSKPASTKTCKRARPAGAVDPAHAPELDRDRPLEYATELRFEKAGVGLTRAHGQTAPGFPSRWPSRCRIHEL